MGPREDLTATSPFLSRLLKQDKGAVPRIGILCCIGNHGSEFVLALAIGRPSKATARIWIIMQKCTAHIHTFHIRDWNVVDLNENLSILLAIQGAAQNA